MIKLINVSKIYNKKAVLKNINLEINKPGIYSFIGDNGSGKTTLLNIIGKIIPVSKGKVINKIKSHTYVSQQVNLIEHLTIKEHFHMFKIDSSYLKKVRLYSKLNDYPTSLSKGQKQRIANILALYSSSSLLLIDEPTSHLDYKNAILLMKELKKISKSKIVLLVSHDLDLVKEYSDKIYKLDNKNLEMVKENNISSKNLINKKTKFNFSKYIKKSIKYHKKINIIFKFIFFLLFSLLLFGINFKSNINEVINISKNNSLDYNKFYLRECEEIKKDKVTLKKCENLSEDKVEQIKKDNYDVFYNYDALMNSLYNSDKFNVIKNEKVELKDGRYPIKYNEIIADDSYKIGEKITLDAFKVISEDKTDIYKTNLTLEVVGIINRESLIKKDYYYLDYDLLEEQIKKEYLINNKKSIYDYFISNELNNYKYVLYFKEVNIQYLKNQKIDYISSSYDYYENIETLSSQISECLLYINIFVMLVSFYYLIKLIIKKLKIKENEIRFLKSMGVNKKNIIKLLNKEQTKLISNAFLFSFVINVIVIAIIFRNYKIQILSNLFILIIVNTINKLITKIIINKRVSV